MDDYPLLHLLWSMLMILGFVIWFWLLITVFSDLFRRHDISGGKKALWLIFMIITGPIGILIYLILNQSAFLPPSPSQASSRRPSPSRLPPQVQHQPRTSSPPTQARRRAPSPERVARAQSQGSQAPRPTPSQQSQRQPAPT